MKRTILLSATLLAAVAGFAQTDTTQKQSDTVQVGNFVIIKTPKKKVSVSIDSNNGVDITIDKRERKKSNVSTNWWIFDLGFTNVRDQTDYAYAQAGSYLRMGRTMDGPVTENSMKLKASKSSNVNIWFFMQKLNISKHVLNLKYGLGLEMYNFRYDNNISYRKDGGGNPYVFNDSIGFSKNKLYAGYITAPLMVNIKPLPDKKRSFSLSAGVSAGYLISSRNKQISERGKIKYKGDFDLQPWRLAAIAEIGLGPVRLYGSYSLNALHNSGTRLEQYPYAVGIRFSNW